MSESSDTREQPGGLGREVVLTLLFAVIATVSAVTLVKTLTKPLAAGSLSPVQWALFAVTVVGATLGFVRAVRFYASLSALARLRRARHDDAAADAEPGPSRLHPVVDDLSWGAITLAIAAINVLAVWAVVLTLVDVFGETGTATGWLLWQLAVLIAALAGVVGLSRSIAAELRDRSRRRRRNAVHVITNKLIYWPVEPGRSPSAGRRVGRVGAMATAAVLAGVSWASASGPLLEPTGERDPAAPVERAGRAAPETGAGAPANARSAQPGRSDAGPGANASDKRRRVARSRKRERSRRDPVPVVTPATSTPPAHVASTPPAATAPATGQPPAPATRPERTRPDRRGRKPGRGGNDRARPTPTPSPTPIPTPTPAPSATPSPTPTPTPAPGPPCGLPPCGAGEGTPPPR